MRDPFTAHTPSLHRRPLIRALTCPLELIRGVQRDLAVIRRQHVVHELDNADLAVIDERGIELDKVVMNHVVHLSGNLKRGMRGFRVLGCLT